MTMFSEMALYMTETFLNNHLIKQNPTLNPEYFTVTSRDALICTYAELCGYLNISDHISVGLTKGRFRMIPSSLKNRSLNSPFSCDH